MGISPSADGDNGLRPLTLMTLLKKGQSKTFHFLTRIKSFVYCITVNCSYKFRFILFYRFKNSGSESSISFMSSKFSQQCTLKNLCISAV